jgi:DNA-binding transcriptional LysR family regulator
VRVSGSLQTNNAEVLRDAAVAGLGIARKSTWDVGHLLQAGDLVPVLPDYSVSTHVAIHAMYPSARFLPPRVSAFIEFLQDRFGNPPYWDRVSGEDEQAAG